MCFMLRTLVAFIAAGLFTTAADAQPWPSLDCSKAKSTFARLACRDEQLMSAYNAYMATLQNAFEQTPDGPIKGKFAKESFDWVKERDTRCGLDDRVDATLQELSGTKPCLLGVLNSRSAHLKSLYPGHAPN